MSSIRYYFWLAEQATGGMHIFWPNFFWLVFIGVLLMIVFTLIGAVLRHDFTAHNLLWSFVPIVVPLVIIAWGVIFKNTGYVVRLEWPWQANALYGLFFLQIPVSAIAVWRAVHVRLFALSISAVVSHYSIGAWFVAAMSITGDWI